MSAGILHRYQASPCAAGPIQPLHAASWCDVVSTYIHIDGLGATLCLQAMAVSKELFQLEEVMRQHSQNSRPSSGGKCTIYFFVHILVCAGSVLHG